MTEAQHQAEVIKWSQHPAVRSMYPELKLLHHIPNGGRRDPVEAKHLKQQGVKKGVPDLFLPSPRSLYHGLYIEMKTETGTSTPEQKWWQEELRQRGYYVEECHGCQSAVRVLEWYLNLDPN